MTDLIEKVARAIGKPENLECAWENFTDEARAAIAVVLKEELDWAIRYAHPDLVNGFTAYIRAIASENGVSLED